MRLKRIKASKRPVIKAISMLTFGSNEEKQIYGPKKKTEFHSHSASISLLSRPFTFIFLGLSSRSESTGWGI